MNSRSVLLSVAVVGLAALGAARPERVSTARMKEVTRLERHFDSVDIELRSRDVSQLSATQRANRAKLIAWLRDYRNAGQFPTNDKFNVPTPFFRDSRGVLCAMAYLIDRSGSGDFVNKIAASRNTAYIRQLADDPALGEWLHQWGLSVSEAARIQPTYGGFPGTTTDENRDRVDSDVALAAIGLGSASLATTAVNFVKPSYLSGFLGVIAGGAAIAVGANNLNVNRGTDRVAAVSIGLGAVSLGSGIYGLLEARERDRERRPWPYDRRDGRRRYSVIVAPDVAMKAGEPRLGLVVGGKF